MISTIQETFSKVNEKWGRNWNVTLCNAFMDDNPSDDIADESADSIGGLNDTNVDEI